MLLDAPMAVLAIDADGLVRSANPAAERLFGDKVAGPHTPAASLIEGLTLTAQATDQAIEKFNVGKTGGGNAPHMTARSVTGEAVAVEVKAAHFTALGETFVTLFIQDATAVRRAEAAAHKLQTVITNNWRLASLGEMASVLAHELNQPLSAIANYIYAARHLLGVEAPDVDRIVASLDAANNQTQRAGETIRRMRGLMSRETGYHADEEIHALVEDLMPALLIRARTVNAKIKVDVAPAETARCDRIQIQQVLGYLVRNAMEAARGEGARLIQIRGRSIRACGSYELIVEDDGPGIAPEIVDQLFEPLASTNKGATGLGLSICKTILEAHGGSISCSASSLGGAAFSVLLKTDSEALA